MIDGTERIDSTVSLSATWQHRSTSIYQIVFFKENWHYLTILSRKTNQIYRLHVLKAQTVASNIWKR